jgi:cell division protein FtsN
MQSNNILQNIMSDEHPDIVEGEEEEGEDQEGEVEGEEVEEVEGEDKEGEVDDEERVTETTEQTQIYEPTESTTAEGEKTEEIEKKSSLLDQTLGFTRQLSASKVKEMIGLDNINNATSMGMDMLKKLTPSVLTGQEQEKRVVVSARMKDLSMLLQICD